MELKPTLCSRCDRLMADHTVCEKCGHVFHGEWPFCPHPPVGNYTNFRDEYPGGITVENYGPHPITFYSESERMAYLKKHCLEMKERWCPLPGTDRDPAGVQDSRKYEDQKTLENGAILMLRAAQGKDFDGIKDGVLRNLTVETVADAGRMHDAIDKA